MKKTIFKIVSMLVLSVLLVLPMQSQVSAATKNESARKIVVFKTGLSDTQKDEIVKNAGAVKLENLRQFNAEAITLNSSAVEEKLRKNSNVLRIEEDAIVTTLARNLKIDKVKRGQTFTWGIRRIKAEKAWSNNIEGKGIRVGIIDTGISSHSDLDANIKGGVNILDPSKTLADEFGHGTHVAGIISAVNNRAGVVGVAPKADLYNIKVIDARGYCYISDVVKAIGWAIDNKMQVINMSLGSGYDSHILREAVVSAKKAGIIMVASAGNTMDMVTYPAAYPEVIAVSAIDQSDAITWWSGRGPEIDLSAPGDNILSTYLENGYAYMSGTSMAAPHVAGVVALALNSPINNFDANANGRWDADEVQNMIQKRASDLGVKGYDNLYGFGLVSVGVSRN